MSEQRPAVADEWARLAHVAQQEHAERNQAQERLAMMERALSLLPGLVNRAFRIAETEGPDALVKAIDRFGVDA